jgi:WD40 repeat protein
MRAVVNTAKEASRASLDLGGDPDLQGLVAFQSYLLNRESGGNPFDADIYNGLYSATKKLVSPAYNIYPNLRASIKSLVWMRSRNGLVAASSDGTIKLLPGDVKRRSTQTLLVNTGLNNESVALSPDESVLAVATNGGGLLFLDLRDGGKVLNQTEAEGKILLFLRNLGRSQSFVSAGIDSRIMKWNFTDQTASLLVDVGARPSALATSSNGSKLAVGTRDGKLYELDPSNPGGMKAIADFGSNNVRAAVYSPGGQILAVGLLDGSIRILAGDRRTTLATLRGPGARVSDLAYSPDGRFMAAASNDGNVYLWNTTEWSQPPLVFTENKGFVLAVCFSLNSEYFFSGSTDFPRMVGRPSEAKHMAGDFCGLLGRNLTEAEWNQHFGQAIPYRKTCPNL